MQVELVTNLIEHYLYVSEGSSPFITKIESTGEAFAVTLELFASRQPGSITTSTLDKTTKYIIPGEASTSTVSVETLTEYISRELHPVIVDRKLYWSQQLTAENIRAMLD